MLLDHEVDGLEAGLEIGADRGHENEEHILPGRPDTHLWTGAEDERTNVKGRPGSVGRDETAIGVHNAMDRVDEHLLRNGFHEDLAA